MTDKIILELTLDELKLIDKYVELNEETESVFDKIKYAYPQLKMTLKREGDYVVVSYNDTTYYRFMNETTFAWYIKKGVSANHPMPTLTMITDAETERLLEGLYYNHIEVKKETAQERGERVHNEMEEVVRESVENKNKDPLEWPTTLKPFMNNCIITGNPPNGYSSWSDWYNELGSKGILVNLRISSNECKPTLKTPEQTEQSLKEAFVEAQQTEKWKELQRKIDEEDNDKNFKNSLDLIKEWGENNKPKTLYQICMDWWDEVFVNQMDDNICIDVLVSKIDKEFIPPSSEKNGYEWEKCLKIMRDKLR